MVEEDVLYVRKAEMDSRDYGMDVWIGSDRPTHKIINGDHVIELTEEERDNYEVATGICE